MKINQYSNYVLKFEKFFLPPGSLHPQNKWEDQVHVQLPPGHWQQKCNTRKILEFYKL